MGKFPSAHLLIHIVQCILNSCSHQEYPNVILDDLSGFAMNTLGVMEKNTVVRLAIQVSAFRTFDEFSFTFFSSPSCGKRSVRMVLKTKIQMLAGSEPSIFDNLPLFQEHDRCVPSSDSAKVPQHLWRTLL